MPKKSIIILILDFKYKAINENMVNPAIATINKTSIHFSLFTMPNAKASRAATDQLTIHFQPDRLCFTCLAKPH